MPTLKDIQEQGSEKLNNIVFKSKEDENTIEHMDIGYDELFNFFNQQTTLAYQAGLDMVLKEIDNEPDIIKSPHNDKWYISLSSLKEKIISNSK